MEATCHLSINNPLHVLVSVQVNLINKRIDTSSIQAIVTPACHPLHVPYWNLLFLLILLMSNAFRKWSIMMRYGLFTCTLSIAHQVFRLEWLNILSLLSWFHLLTLHLCLIKFISNTSLQMYEALFPICLCMCSCAWVFNASACYEKLFMIFMNFLNHMLIELLMRKY